LKESFKKIYDSIHGFIRFNDLESQLIDSTFFQRLQFIHQLGIAFLVYPGATHTRFEHSLGTMELTTRIFDRLRTKHDLPETDYFRQILRFAALCHDLGHLPFSHVAEKELIPEGHEEWTLRAIHSKELSLIWEKAQQRFPHKDIVNDICKMAIGENKILKLYRKKGEDIQPSILFNDWEKLFSQIICADFFGADRMDYLMRDAKCTGVSYGLFDYHQLIETLTILPPLELGVEEDGVEACEALLLARLFMHKRVYQYSSVKAYTFHLRRLMKNYCRWQNDKEYFHLRDCEILAHAHALSEKPEEENDPDAIALIDRKQRFNAYKLPPEMTDETLRAFQKRKQISNQEIAWEFQNKTNPPIFLNFPVLKRNGQIINARYCSEISIPFESANWLYLSQKYLFDLKS
jgi:uncharacterized protein